MTLLISIDFIIFNKNVANTADILWYIAIYCDILRYIAIYCDILRYIAIYCEEEIENMFLRRKIWGVIVDSNLSFEEHISKKVKTANGIVGLIRGSFSHLDCQSFRKIYTAFVRPHLKYAQSLCAPHLSKHIDMLEKVQMRATKLVDGLGNIEYSEWLRRLNLLTLVYRRMRGDVIEIFKHLRTYDVETLSPSFQLRNRPSRKHIPTQTTENKGRIERDTVQWILLPRCKTMEWFASRCRQRTECQHP